MASKYFYRVVIRNDYLGEVKEIGAHTEYDLQLKINEQYRKWDEKVQRRQMQQNKEHMKNLAESLTQEAERKINQYNKIIKKINKKTSEQYYESLKDKSEYKKFVSQKEKPAGLEFVYQELNVPKESFWEMFSSSQKEDRLKKEKEAAELLQQRYKVYQGLVEKEKQEYEEEKEKFLKKQDKHNKDIDKKKEKFYTGDVEEIEQYFNYVLSSSIYPEDFLIDFDLQYKEDQKTIIVSYYLPNSESVPKIKEQKYVASRNQIEKVFLNDKSFKQFYNDIVYMICLRTIKEILSSDESCFVENVVFNGWVKYIDKSNGQDCESCVITLEVTKEKFNAINLDNIEYKECIKGLKGIFAPDILTLTPVVPYLNINREDSRFIESKEVSGIQLDGFNLATMPWEDFEYFVRELFDKMFNRDGGEVKVTQASHDGGVDAIAFDDDPIRGGKFVIQAKRYNNVVPVSAVRDLYGTMIHEGATKGILVTTSFYGKEAYDFAKDKPITLIDGQALLGLLSKYGYDKLTIKIKDNK